MRKTTHYRFLVSTTESEFKECRPMWSKYQLFIVQSILCFGLITLIRDSGQFKPAVVFTGLLYNIDCRVKLHRVGGPTITISNAPCEFATLCWLL